MNIQKFLPKSVKLDPLQLDTLKKLQESLFAFKDSKLERVLKIFGISKFNNKKGGIYLQGSVGSGKTMLMETLFNSFEEKKELIHYQDFIQKLHERIHAASLRERKNILKSIAHQYSKKVNYLFLDEFEIKDITDAMIMGPLFRELLNNNTFIFLTTNSVPENLYKDGLQRESFLPFIKMIKEKFEILSLNSNDYRLKKSSKPQTNIFFPINSQNRDKIENIIKSLTKNNFHITTLEVFARKITFTKTYQNILVADFDELFMQDFSYIDYIHITQKFKTIIVKSIPIIEPTNTNIAVRFINFIDNAYFYKTKLFMNLEAPIEKIYENGQRSAEFKRTISRIYELSNE